MHSIDEWLNNMEELTDRLIVNNKGIAKDMLIEEVQGQLRNLIIPLDKPFENSAMSRSEFFCNSVLFKGLDYASYCLVLIV
jgi:hypothetical protein